MAGDHNPMHHDDDFAAASRFGRIIASGPQTTSVFAALLATHFSAPFNGQARAMLGLEFTFKYLLPVFADQNLHMRWRITEIVPKENMAGEIVVLEGEVQNNSGETLLTGVGKVLVLAKL